MKQKGHTRNSSVSVPSKFFQKYDKVSWAIALLFILNSLNKLNHCLLLNISLIVGLSRKVSW